MTLVMMLHRCRGHLQEQPCECVISSLIQYIWVYTELLFCYFTKRKNVGFLFAPVSICQQDCTKRTDPICSKSGGGMGHGLRRNPLNFGADVVKGVDESKTDV